MNEEASKRLLEVLKANRYGIKDLAKWLNISYASAYKRVKLTHSYSYDDIQAIGKVLGGKNIKYIFFSNML